MILLNAFRPIKVSTSCTLINTIVIGLLSFALTIAWAPATSAQLSPLMNSINSTTPSRALDAGVEHLGDIEVAPIRLDGQVLFKVASPTVWDRDKPENHIPVEVRAKQIEASLNRIVGNYKIHLPLLHELETDAVYDPETLNVYVAKLNNETTIFVKDNAHPLPFPLLTVTQADAEYAGVPIEETAVAIQGEIERGLRQALQDRSPNHLGLQTLKAVLVALGTFSGSFILWILSKLLHKRDKFLKARQANEAEKSSLALNQAFDKPLDESDPTFRRLSILHEWKHQSALERRRSLIILLIWLVNRVQIILWLGGVLLVLSLFPWTKPLLWAILSLPVKLLGIWLVVGLINLLINTLLNLLEKFWNHHHIFVSEDEQRRSLRIATTLNALKDIKMTIIYLIAIIWGISVLGVPTGSILAISGLIAVALSLSVQNVVKDIVTGCLILWEDQFAVGDTIAIQNTTGHLASGLVENMNLRITQLRNLEGRLITIPNSTITQVQNMTRGWSQVDFSVEVSHELDIRLNRK
jgi:small conductance mechanosensitive channel